MFGLSTLISSYIHKCCNFVLYVFFPFFICYPVLFHLISNYVSSSALSLFGETNKMKNEMKNWKVLDSNPLESLLQQLGMKVKTG